MPGLMKGKHFTRAVGILLVTLLVTLLLGAGAVDKDKEKDKGKDSGEEAPQKYDPLQKVRVKFEDGDYDAVVKGVKDLRTSAVKLTAEQRGQLGIWEGESLLRSGKYADADKAFVALA